MLSAATKPHGNLSTHDMLFFVPVTFDNVCQAIPWPPVNTPIQHACALPQDHLLKIRAFLFEPPPLLFQGFQALRGCLRRRLLRREPLRPGGLQQPPQLCVLLRQYLGRRITRLQLPGII